MDKNNYCIIMAGGTGSRFWPVSKNDLPKQFLNLGESGKSFLRMTYERFLKIFPKENILITTAERYKELIKSQIPELNEDNLLLEPYSRNTAPAIAYATYSLLKRNPDARMVVTPANHIIENGQEFADVIEKSFDYISRNDVLMCLGVTPNRPDTNYGYIQACGGKKACQTGNPLKVKTFTQKPSKELAEIFIETGEFFWNTGIYFWKASTIREELEKHLGEVTGLFYGWDKVLGTKMEQEFIARAYTDCPNISINYSVMEKTERAWICPVKFGWTDIGTWESLHNYMPKDKGRNASNAESTMFEDTSNTLAITTDKKKLIAVKGLENYMIVDTGDVLLICPKDDRQYKDFVCQRAMPQYEKFR